MLPIQVSVDSNVFLLFVEKESKSSSSQLAQYFPDLVLTLRDFFLDLQVEGKPATEDEYMGHCLGLGDEPEDDDEEEFDKIKFTIRKYFQKRKCFVFPRPINVSHIEREKKDV